MIFALCLFVFIVWCYWQSAQHIVNQSSLGISNDDEETDFDDSIIRKRSMLVKKHNSSESPFHLRGSYWATSESADLISLFGSSWLKGREGSDAENANTFDQRFQSIHSCYFSSAGVKFNFFQKINIFCTNNILLIICAYLSNYFYF